MNGFVDISEAEYRQAEGVSQSALKKLPRRLIYHATYISKCAPDDEQSRSMELGHVIHGVALQGKKLDDLVRIYPPNCFKKSKETKEYINALNPGPADEFRSSLPPGCIAIKEDEYSDMQATAEAIERTIGKIIHAPTVKREQPLFWTDEETQLKCKALLDIYAPQSATIIDLKSTDDASPKKFRTQLENLDYWLQHAHYSAGVEAITGKPCEFLFLAVEKTWPYQCGLYGLKPSSKASARDARDRWLRTLKDCIDNNDWDDAWEKYPTYLDVRDFAYERV